MFSPSHNSYLENLLIQVWSVREGVGRVFPYFAGTLSNLLHSSTQSAVERVADQQTSKQYSPHERILLRKIRKDGLGGLAYTSNLSERCCESS